MPVIYDLTGGEAQNVLRHLDPWGRTQAALAIKPWSRLGTLPARKLVLVGSQFDASPQRLAQLAAAAPQAEELQLFLDPTTREDTVHAILECLGGRTCLTSLVIAEANPFGNPPRTPLLGPSLSFVAPYLTSLTLYVQGSRLRTSIEGLHHLLACQNLQHLKLAPASLDGSSSFRGLTAAGLLVLAQLPPLTSAELVLNVSSSHWVHLPWISDTDLEDMLPVGLPNLGPQLRAPGVPQEVAEEVIQMCQERRWPFIVGALHMLARRHGPTLRRLSLGGGRARNQRPITWAGPWDMPHLEHYSSDWHIQVDLALAEVPPLACRSSLTSLQLKQRVDSAVWEMLPQKLPKLQLLDVDVCGRWDNSYMSAVDALQRGLQGRPAGILNLEALSCLTALRLVCLPGTSLTACSHLTQLRDLEVSLLSDGVPVHFLLKYRAFLEVLGALSQLTQLRIAGPGTWEVEGSSWTGLAGSLPNLKRLSVAAVMTGRISALPGTRLVELHLDAGATWPPLQLAGKALPASLTQLHLRMAQVTDTPQEPLNTAAAVQQAWQHSLFWAGPPLQLPQLKELLLGGVSSWMPATAFSGSPITRLQLLAGLPACADAPIDIDARPVDLYIYCQALPLLRELQVDMSTGHAGPEPAPLPDLTPLIILQQLASLRLVAACFAGVCTPPDGAPLGPILQELLQLTRLELMETGGDTSLLEVPGLGQALGGCRSLRVLQLHPCWTMWTRTGSRYCVTAEEESKEGNAQAYRELLPLPGNCVVLPFEEPLCGQL